jgi:hypothetical protein
LIASESNSEEGMSRGGDFAANNSRLRVHSTAAIVCARLGDEDGVLAHTNTSAAVRKLLHDSLPEGSRGRARLLQH